MKSISLALDVQMFLLLLVAVVLGALVTYERERAGKPADVRTHGMVSLDAALFAVVSLDRFGGTGDPARVTAQSIRANVTAPPSSIITTSATISIRWA